MGQRHSPLVLQVDRRPRLKAVVCLDGRPVPKVVRFHSCAFQDYDSDSWGRLYQYALAFGSSGYLHRARPAKWHTMFLTPFRPSSYMQIKLHAAGVSQKQTQSANLSNGSGRHKLGNTYRCSRQCKNVNPVCALNAEWQTCEVSSRWKQVGGKEGGSLHACLQSAAQSLPRSSACCCGAPSPSAPQSAA